MEGKGRKALRPRKSEIKTRRKIVETSRNETLNE
jgi:hypothetical protein